MPNAGPSAPPRPFRTAAVLGSGVMGSQIAAHLANAGLTVHLLDLATEEGDRNAVARASLAAAAKLNPKPFFTPDVIRRVRVGNFDDDLEVLADVDWVIEAVIEKLDIKQGLMARIEAVAGPDTVIATNTSGLPIHQIAAGRGDDFRRRFLGCHFFNPPRYLKLFELIPTAETDPSIVQRVSHFARLHLGKGVVVAKDTPNFIGNRIGIYTAMMAIREVTEHGYSIEEVDQLTGTLVGHAKSATFRTADLVGLDVLVHVAENLHDAVEDDESREVFRPPWLLKKLVERGSLGAKTKEGFYKKEDGKILSIDPESMKYKAPRSKKLGDLDKLRRAGGLPARLRALYDDTGRAGEHFRRVTLDQLGYAARRLPVIADHVEDVDRALRLGFGWRLGPFQVWDAIGFARVLGDMREEHIKVPEWIEQMAVRGAASFYRGDEAVRAGPDTFESEAPSDSLEALSLGDGPPITVGDREDEEAADEGPQQWAPAGGWVPVPVRADEIDVAALAADRTAEVWSNDEAALLHLGDGVLLYEFRSKMNAIGRAVLDGLLAAINRVEGDPAWHGLVVGNGKDNFSVGANLFEVGKAAVGGQWDEIASGVAAFQEVCQRIRYASKPVIVAPQGQTLGGACEMTMACRHPVLAAESYVGLVEIGAGLIPAGGGTMRMAAWAAESAASEATEHVMPFLRAAFETVATAKVALSAHEAQRLGYVHPGATIVMNAERRLFVAKQEVLRLASEGYAPPPVRTAIRVLGAPARTVFEIGVEHLALGGFVPEHLGHVAKRIAWVITGGDLVAPAHLHEDRLLELEREVFLSLLGETKTQQQIADILTRNEPKAKQVMAKSLVSLSSVFRKKPPQQKKA